MDSPLQLLFFFTPRLSLTLLLALGQVQSSFSSKVKWKSLSRVRLFVNPWTIQSMEFSRPEYWSGVGFPFSGRGSGGSSQPRDRTLVSRIVGGLVTSWAIGKPKNTWVGSLSLLQLIFPTQESNQGLLHCRQILYQLSYQGGPLLLRWWVTD